ncbi:MAG: hypothetical protein LAP85_06705 [Acidobacteriia bacterium]|nr:hypothetical protein [Terriglobia bacterium]
MNTDEINHEGDVQLEDALKEFRASAFASVERPESFWTAQLKAVLERMEQHRKVVPWRPLLTWGTAAVIVVAVAGIWLLSPRALPAPDFAAGYDQDLLVDVERLTDSQMPLALEPAMILADEIKAGIATRKAP